MVQHFSHRYLARIISWRAVRSVSRHALKQYFRQMTPDTGPIDINVNSDAVAALFNKIGPGILVTHSHSGGMGWVTVIKSPNVQASVVSFEPGSNFMFPEGEVPAPIAKFCRSA